MSFLDKKIDKELLSKLFIYLAIPIVNLFILFFLIYIWSRDCVELIFPDDILLQYIISILLLLFIYPSLILSRYISKRKSLLKSSFYNQLIYVIIFTVLISGYKYFQFTKWTLNNHIFQKEIRNTLCNKINNQSFLANGSSGENLTIQEFRIIHKKIGQDNLPDNASDISYSYSYDGFLPDFSNWLTYSIPIEIEIDTFDKGEEHQWYSRQSYIIVDNRKVVTFSNGSM